MAARNIQTSHDLAAALEVAARALRAFPDLSLQELSQTLAQGQHPKKATASAGKPVDQAQLEDLSRRFSGLARDEAEAELRNLKVDSIRQLAASLGIRIPSKATKAEATSTLLAHVFDIPAGQELIRTYHRRHAAP